MRIKDGAEGDPALLLSKSKFYFCKNQDELFRPMIFLPWHFESPKHCWIWGKWDLWRKHHKCITKINQKDKQPASDGAGRWNAPQLAFLYIFDQIKESTTKATSGLMTWMIRRLWAGLKLRIEESSAFQSGQRGCGKGGWLEEDHEVGEGLHEDGEGKLEEKLEEEEGRKLLQGCSTVAATPPPLSLAASVSKRNHSRPPPLHRNRTQIHLPSKLSEFTNSRKNNHL